MTSDSEQLGKVSYFANIANGNPTTKFWSRSGQIIILSIFNSPFSVNDALIQELQVVQEPFFASKTVFHAGSAFVFELNKG